MATHKRTASTQGNASDGQSMGLDLHAISAAAKKLTRLAKKSPCGSDFATAAMEFVYLLKKVPIGITELNRRAELVERSTSAGSPFGQAQQQALLQLASTPLVNEPAQAAIPRTPQSETTLGEIERQRAAIARVLEEIKKLSNIAPTSRQVWNDYLVECNDVIQAAIGLEVDGCRVLQAVLNAPPNLTSGQTPTQAQSFEATIVNTFLESEIGTVHQTDVAKAAESLVRWLQAQATSSGSAAAGAIAKPKAKRGSPKADYETERAEAKLAAEWRRVRDVGEESKAEFAKRKGYTLKAFDALLDRVRHR